jgi:hypothetical protein
MLRGSARLPDLRVSHQGEVQVGLPHWKRRKEVFAEGWDSPIAPASRHAAIFLLHCPSFSSCLILPSEVHCWADRSSTFLAELSSGAGIGLMGGGPGFG